MDRMLYLGMTGAKHTALAQVTNSNNLANADTTGFRSDFHVLVADALQGPGFPTRHNAISDGRATQLAAGALQHTGRPLDIAVEGNGWLVVQGPDGGEAYTRRGDLQITANGQLINGAGQPLLGEGGLVALPEHASVSIGSDGTVSVVPLGQGPETQVVVDRLRVVELDPNQTVKGNDGLMRHGDGRPGIPTNQARVVSGTLEASNVNTVDAMVNMISLARSYEMQVKVMSTAKEMADTSSRLLRLE